MPRYSSPAPPPSAHQPGRVLRAVALSAVSAGVLVLAAAAFIFSYSGIHAIAQQAGISATVARGYPVIFDALLVIACAAVLSLRGAGAVSRFYAWLSLLVLLGVTAGADALHSTGTAVPHRTAALVAAIIPWILLLIGFGLLLAMLRHFRLHRAAPAAPAAAAPVLPDARRPAALPPGPTSAPGPPPPVQAPVPHPVQAPGQTQTQAPVPPPVQAPGQTQTQAPVQAPGQAPVPPPAAPAPPAAEPAASPAPAAAGPPVSVPAQAPSEQAEPVSANGSGRPAAATARPDPSAGPEVADLASDPGSGGSEAADPADAAVPEEIFAAPPADADGTPGRPPGQPGRPPAPQPAFHRMWSSPTPPGDEEED